MRPAFFWRTKNYPGITAKRHEWFDSAAIVCRKSRRVDDINMWNSPMPSYNTRRNGCKLTEQTNRTGSFVFCRRSRLFGEFRRRRFRRKTRYSVIKSCVFSVSLDISNSISKRIRSDRRVCMFCTAPEKVLSAKSVNDFFSPKLTHRIVQLCTHVIRSQVVPTEPALGFL